MVNLLAPAWLEWTGYVLLAILILLVMVTIHEFGHFLMGKLLGFRIDEFSVGFGPAFFKKKRKKTGELFSLRLIPLGGYCAFHGEDGIEETEGSVFSEETETTVSSKKTWKARGRVVTEDGDFTNMRPWKRILVLVSGAAMNYLLALLLLIVCFLAYGQTMVAAYRVTPDETPGYSLQDCDALLEIEGNALYLTTDVARSLNGKKEGDLVKVRVSRPVDLEWVRDEETGELRPHYTARREMTVEIRLRCDVNVKNSAEFDSVWEALGVESRENGDGAREYLLANCAIRFGFWESVGRACVYSVRIADSIFRVIGELITGALGIRALGGPVTTVKTAAQVASTGFRGFLEIAGFIGVNLAVFNLLPIPALDGSKVVFTAIEWIRGKPISRKIEAVIHAVGFVLLLGFAVLVDILQFI